VIEIIPLGEASPDVKEVLEGALKDDELNYVVLIGQTKSGAWYFAASESDPYKAMHSADQFKRFLLEHTE
jgi:hypothetical protein